jgi:hypothetical protein
MTSLSLFVSSGALNNLTTPSSSAVFCLYPSGIPLRYEMAAGFDLAQNTTQLYRSLKPP